jgi:hypothetical protein
MKLVSGGGRAFSCGDKVGQIEAFSIMLLYLQIGHFPFDVCH